jgi:hypothetical protein
MKWTETYMSEEVRSDEIEGLCGVGDETYKFPSSEDLTTPVRMIGERKTTLRSSAQKLCEEKTTSVQDQGQEADDDETQPLSWGPCHEGSEKGRERLGSHPANSVTQRARVSESWADLNRVWSQVSLNPERVSTPAEKHQCDLLSFGFQSTPGEGNRRKKSDGGNKDAAEMTADVHFEDDEEVESDFEQEEKREAEGRGGESQETQILSWANDEDAAEEKTTEREEVDVDGDEQSLFLPTQGDLNSQSRRFLHLEW